MSATHYEIPHVDIFICIEWQEKEIRVPKKTHPEKTPGISSYHTLKDKYPPPLFFSLLYSSQFESQLNKLPSQGHLREKDRLEAELDRLDKELGSVRMSLKRFHVLKSTI